MKNYGIIQFKNSNIDNFTSNIGMNIRKKTNFLLRRLLKLAIKEKIIIDHYPKLNDKEPYIFVSLHNFVEDTISNLATIDRNTYLLFGTTNQLEVNKEMYAAWLNGFIYVDRNNTQSRKDAINKMLRVLKNGNSVLIFPEGGFNNTENLLCQKLFSSPYILSKQTGIKVVPIAPFYEFNSDKIYMNIGEPLDLSKYNNKKEALLNLRDVLSTLLWYSIEKHGTMLKRKELGINYKNDFMEQRRLEYMKTNWTKDVWNEELTRYLDSDDKEFLAVQESYDQFISDNPICQKMLHSATLARRLDDRSHNFKKYMHENWNK